MCTTVWFPELGKVVETQGELAAIIAPDELVREEGYDDEAFEHDSCLCPINVPDTLAGVGYWVTSGWAADDGFTDFVARKSVSEHLPDRTVE